jgi:spore coat polysaccharide biosynthesis protein SpsF
LVPRHEQAVVIAGILLSVREKATRLPGKVLKPMGGGNVTQFLIRRLKRSTRAQHVVLATSTDPRDVVLCDVAAGEGIAAVRGSPDDKLLRYRDACRAFALDFAVVVDGDDPFVSVEHIDRLIDHAAAQPVDFVSCADLPLGATGFGLAASALERVCAGRSEDNTEIWGDFFVKDPRFTCAQLRETEPLFRRPDIRMTLDYEEDYRFFLAVIEGLGPRTTEPSFTEIMRYLADHPEIVAINRGVHAIYEAHLRASAGRQGAPGQAP